MKTFFLTGILLMGILGPASALEALPGSLTFEKPIVKRAKLPIGSTVTHEFHYRGQRIKELYVVRPDHSLKLTWRSASSSR
ncbi:hypothetical protein ACWGPT_02920 [Pseudorhizobium sp. NPDC055634]